MLFLYRPRQTWMPFGLPRNRTEQAAYNRRLQEQFAATRRVPPAVPAGPAPEAYDPVARLEQLAELHRSGVLTDAEFESAKTRLLAR
jgi:Short C-terminal domain